MAYFLQMDGVDDLLRTAPNISIDRIVLDAHVNEKTGTYNVLDARTTGSNAYYFNAGFTSTFTTFYGDGVLDKKTGLLNKRSTYDFRSSSAFTINSNGIEIFASYLAGGFASGNIYQVTAYNGATIVFDYDMTTQTVQDQSGNGRHATLTGGTWVDDGSGGGAVIDAGTITISAESSLTSSASRILTSNATLQGDTTFTANAQRILNGMSSISVDSGLSVIASKILGGQSDLNADSELTADANVLTVGITIDLSASTTLTADGSKLVQGTSILTANGEVIAKGSLTLGGEATLISDSELSLFIGEYYRQIIEYTLTITPEIRVETTITRRKDFDVNI